MIRLLFITELGGIIMFVTIEFFEHMDIFTQSFSNFLFSIMYLLLRSPFYIHLILPLVFSYFNTDTSHPYGQRE